MSGTLSAILRRENIHARNFPNTGNFPNALISFRSGCALVTKEWKLGVEMKPFHLKTFLILIGFVLKRIHQSCQTLQKAC